MTLEQSDAVDCVHFFTQQFWLEGQWRDACRLPLMRPRKIKITLRHTDWWVWEFGAKFGIDPRLAGRVPWDEMGREPREDDVDVGFGCQFRHLRGLLELEMEFETTQSRLAEMEAIVQRALSWRFETCDGNVLSTEGTSVVRRLWSVGQPWCHQYYRDNDWQGLESGGTSGLSGVGLRSDSAAIAYIVFSVTWRAQPPAQEPTASVKDVAKAG